jgi:hypothetical protein
MLYQITIQIDTEDGAGQIKVATSDGRGFTQPIAPNGDAAATFNQCLRGYLAGFDLQGFDAFLAG